MRQALALYPLARLGTWTFVVIPSADWKSLILSVGADPKIPAFSVLAQSTTILDESLFSPTVDRKKELLLIYGKSGNDLLDLAVTHELGHTICKETKERKADDYGLELRLTKDVDCKKKR